MHIPKISISIAFKKDDLSPKKPSLRFKKILKTKTVSLKLKKQRGPLFSLKCSRFIKLARKIRRIATIITASKINSLKKVSLWLFKSTF